MLNKSEIFKIQRPVSNSSLLLIYNKDRSICSQIPITQEVAKLMATSYKIYVRGYVNNDGILQIEEKVSQQRW